MAAGRWFDRTFELGLQASAFPPILGRLRSLPDRLERAVRSAPDERLRLVTEHNDHHLNTIATLAA